MKTTSEEPPTKKARRSAEELKILYMEECLKMKREEHAKRMSILNKIEEEIDTRLQNRTEPSDKSYLRMLNDTEF